MEMTPVTSSQIAAVGFDKENEKIVVEFNSGSQYAYSDCTYDMYEEFIGAESVGQYFAKNIKILPYEKQI